MVGATRTKTFEGLALDPMPNFHRFEQVNKSSEIRRRKEEEIRMKNLETNTILKFRTVITDCFDFYGRDIRTLGEGN